MVIKLRAHHGRRRSLRLRLVSVAALPLRSVGTQWRLSLSQLLALVDDLLEVTDCLDFMLSGAWLPSLR